ncbi:DMT family transporter [Mesorhizobium sp.]|uniref:DMT family transporter n=1 Tax=Mesorhizobium sp. TaxID=1871066 RepID=UPI000FE7864E|nr:DMT family transporter [Mesorhizobium sp.]RWP03238.1 MAG: EamA family transporter [Mesorhizobium sp.]
MTDIAAATDTAAERTLGIILVSSSAAVFGLTGVLTKSIHADPLTIICWRGFVGAILISFYVLWRRHRSGNRETLRLGWRGWLLAVEGALASIAFISAFKFTFVANVAVIYATAPFVTALLAWVLTREPFRLQTMVAAAVSLCGVAIMVWSGFGSGNLFGDGLALLMTIGSGLYMEGARLIPPAESGLLGSAEVPFAILFAFLFLGEIAPAASMIGGIIVLCAVFAHAGRDWLRARSQRMAGPQRVASNIS